jgi:hypothetical protein
MLLPYFFDLIPEKIGGFFGKLFAWNPEGKKVILSIDESGDPSLTRKIINGTIIQCFYNQKRKTNDAIIYLDTPLNYNGKNITQLLVSPRFKGHGLNRILLTWSVVSIFPNNKTEKQLESMPKDVIGIGLLKLMKLP